MTRSKPLSKSLFISAPAHRDLAHIGDYTQRTWGAVQKRKYLNAIKTAFKALRDNPAMGAVRDDVSSGLRALTVEKHLVFYRDQEDGTLAIVRVLHHAMDPAEHIHQSKA